MCPAMFSSLEQVVFWRKSSVESSFKNIEMATNLLKDQTVFIENADSEAADSNLPYESVPEALVRHYSTGGL